MRNKIAVVILILLLSSCVWIDQMLQEQAVPKNQMCPDDFLACR